MSIAEKACELQVKAPDVIYIKAVLMNASFYTLKL